MHPIGADVVGRHAWHAEQRGCKVAGEHDGCEGRPKTSDLRRAPIGAPQEVVSVELRRTKQRAWELETYPTRRPLSATPRRPTTCLRHAQSPYFLKRHAPTRNCVPLLCHRLEPTGQCSPRWFVIRCLPINKIRKHHASMLKMLLMVHLPNHPHLHSTRLLNAQNHRRCTWSSLFRTCHHSSNNESLLAKGAESPQTDGQPMRHHA